MIGSDTARFLRAFLQAPRTIGAIAPSSKRLATMMLDQTLLPNDRVIVEYGPGTGVFTTEILSRKNAEARFLAIEVDSELGQRFADRFPEVDLCRDSVENLPALLSERGLASAHCIISGLPWAVFSDDVQDRLLEVTVSALAPEGRFATFAYIQGLMLPAAQRFASKLKARFSDVSRSPIVWRNLPPALVYRCRR